MNKDCRALSVERGAVERARDARGWNPADPAVHVAFTAAWRTLTTARDAHVAATGCTQMH